MLTLTSSLRFSARTQMSPEGFGSASVRRVDLRALWPLKSEEECFLFLLLAALAGALTKSAVRTNRAIRCIGETEARSRPAWISRNRVLKRSKKPNGIRSHITCVQLLGAQRDSESGSSRPD